MTFAMMKLKNVKNKLRGEHFLTLADFSKEEIMYFIEYALYLKKEQKSGNSHQLLAGKTLAMIFEKASTRTRVSFETGMFQLGGHALFLNKEDLQLRNGESIKDTANVLSRYVDGIMIRTFEHNMVEELAENASIPIINGLTDDYHPCQVLADLMTIYEKKGTFKGNKLAFIGDGNNMANSLLIGCAIMGMDCSVAVPEDYKVDPEIFKIAQQKALKSGATIEQTHDAKTAIQDADIVYTDVWTSMGMEGEAEARLQAFTKFQVNEELITHAKDDYLFLHCLPAHRGEEVTAEIIDGPHSVVFDEAENRLHVQKAILASVM